MEGKVLLTNTLLSEVVGLTPYKSTSIGLPSDTERDEDLRGMIGVDGPPGVFPTGDKCESLDFWWT